MSVTPPTTTSPSLTPRAAAGGPVVDTWRSPYSRLRPLGVAAVTLEDNFWAPRRAMNRTVTLPAQYRLCVETGRLENFRRAAGRADGPFQGRVFNDSDVYKWLEAACWTLATEHDAALRAHVDAVIALVAAAQDADGYLDTYFTHERRGERWTDLAWMHELYCAGHLIQAAIAHRRATGEGTLLAVAVRLADHVDAVFGPDKRRGACGHPEVEMALVELYRETGTGRYLQLAQFFVDMHGQTPPVITGDAYCQDHAAFRVQREVVGHAVRALYLYCGATDIYAETGEEALREALGALWRNLQERKVYVTGGVGARYEGESCGDDYELPNRRAYAETCAAIAHVMWAWRLLLLTGEGVYGDALETALYNGVLCGLSLDGQTYFYQNPLADRGSHRREPWFGTACCPPNVARLLASLPGYVYATSDAGIWVHLYVASTAKVALPAAGEVRIRQRSAYPWDGEITLEVTPARPARFSLFLRIPAWAGEASVAVNGEAVAGAVEAGSYLELRRDWRAGDVAQLALPLSIRVLTSHPHVLANYGRVAVMRGPLVYCVEDADHAGIDVWDVALPRGAQWEAQWRPALLGGIVTLQTGAVAATPAGADGPLYRVDGAGRTPHRPMGLTAIPYYAWANRTPGTMQVWLPRAGDLPL